MASPSTLQTLPPELRAQIFHALFTRARAGLRPVPNISFSVSNKFSGPCEVCSDTTYQHHPGLAYLVSPLLVSRQFHVEALPILYEHLVLSLDDPLAANMLLNQSQWGFSALSERVRWVEVVWHLETPDVQTQREGMRGLVDGLRRARGSTDGKGSEPLNSLRGLYVEMHMDAPGSYDLLTPGIHYMSPFVADPANSASTTTSPQTDMIHPQNSKPIFPSPGITLSLAYQKSYTMFSSPLLGDITTADLKDEHELCLRELLSDPAFIQAVLRSRTISLGAEASEAPRRLVRAVDDGAGTAAEEAEQEQTIALLLIARKHERSWMRGLAKRRLAEMEDGEEKERVRRAMGAFLDGEEGGWW
ncbi:uncharacterized protein AB675_7774 [Cyphellophora attinorum]|uniref:Uncharacterized protein n=1 Tax=Cyphellophora attinorum TaxID=1664694 RepID=A0A0N1HUG1_9EURO|nr:uncharacterized protein AB675_7774 [Phialophora attinorum]KPI40560.1 hypothetical protein AB675_7774 [Phialophora attinorum]